MRAGKLSTRSRPTWDCPEGSDCNDSLSDKHCIHEVPYSPSHHEVASRACGSHTVQYRRLKESLEFFVRRLLLRIVLFWDFGFIIAVGWCLLPRFLPCTRCFVLACRPWCILELVVLKRERRSKERERRKCEMQCGRVWIGLCFGFSISV